MPKIIDLTGQKFGRITYVRRAPKRPNDYRSWWECKCDCGKTVKKLAVHRLKFQSCGCKQREIAREMGFARHSENHPSWKGGKILDGNGYVKCSARGHPRLKNFKSPERHSYIFEHVLVMEKHLGRYLLNTERVHHINGIRTDNRIENLELWDKAHPHGQRHEDKMKWHMSELLKKCDRRTLVEFCSEVLK